MPVDQPGRQVLRMPERIAAPVTHAAVHRVPEPVVRPIVEPAQPVLDLQVLLEADLAVQAPALLELDLLVLPTLDQVLARQALLEQDLPVLLVVELVQQALGLDLQVQALQLVQVHRVAQPEQTTTGNFENLEPRKRLLRQPFFMTFRNTNLKNHLKAICVPKLEMRNRKFEISSR